MATFMTTDPWRSFSRLGPPASTFMFHGVGFNTPENARLEEKFLVERLESLRADQKRIGRVVADRTDLEEEEISRLFLEQETKSGLQAAAFPLVYR